MANSNPRRLVVALAIVTAGVTLAVPAGAQFSNGRSAFDQRPRAERVQFHDFFRFFDNRVPANPYNPYNPFNSTRPPRTIETDKAPPPRKVETPPTSTVLVIGDLFADWLGYGLEEAFADTAEIGIVRKIRPYSGLVRYETRADAPEWSQAVKDVLAMEKPTAIVVMLGVNDRLPLRDHAPPHPGAATTSPQGQGAARANYRAEQNEHCAAGGNYRTEQNQAASWISRHHWLSITGEPMTYSKSFTRSREWVQLRNLEGASAASAVTLKADNRLRRSK